ncbi:MAG: hypothetical protein KDC92_03770, partial [Bacteroidetes bacterium]|nr:hypothetical protein [Bacteroidota bacterium]
MKKIFTSLLIFLAGFLLIPDQAKATHVMGSDIQWECLGGDKYRIKVTGYRDSNGVQLSNTAISFRGACSGIATSTQSMSAAKDITPVCPGQCTRCKSRGCNFAYGIEARELVTTIDVSQFKKQGCCEITISWAQCCRNGAITTGAANQNFYVEAKLNICQTPCDNSPTFTGDPLAIICLGRDFIYNQGAQDKDVDPKTGSQADSLVYSLSDPLTASGSKTSWTSPYSAQQPLKYLGFPKTDYRIDQFPFGFHLDSTTGDLLFRPMSIQQTVLTIQIEQFRNGKRIGVTRRDIQVVVIKCPDNTPPVISGINCSKPVAANFKTEACANERLCFTVCTSDKDRDDTVTIGWNAGIPGATFTVVNPGAKRENGRFCWTPTEAHANQKPPVFRFVVNAKDNACPVNGFAGRTFTIRVKLPPKAVYDTLLADCGVAEFRAERRGTVGIGQYLWALDGKLFPRKGGMADTLIHKFKTPGKKPFSLVLVGSNGCNVTLEDTMTIPEYVNVEGFRDTTVCAGTELKFTTLVRYNVGKYKLGWATDDGTTTLAGNVSSLTYKFGTESKDIIISIEDSVCENSDTLNITINNPPKLDLGNTQRICFYDDHEFIPLLTPVDTNNRDQFGQRIPDTDTNYRFAWYKNNLKSLVGIYPTYTARDSAKYYLQVFDSLGCGAIDSVDLRVNPERNWQPKPTTICIGDTAKLKVNERSATSKFFWFEPAIDRKIADSAAMPGVTKVYSTADSIIPTNPLPYQDTSYGIRWMETIGGVTCTEYHIVDIKVNPLPVVDVLPLPPLCEDYGKLDLRTYCSPAHFTGKGGVWTDDDPNLEKVTKSGNNYRFDSEVAGADGEKTKQHKLYYTYKDVNGCINIDSGVINVKPLPVLELTEESTTMCNNEDPRNLDQYVVKEKGGKWSWPNQQSGLTSVYQSDLNGDGIVEWVFDVTGVREGKKTLQYYYKNKITECEQTIEFIIDVIKVPEVDAGDYDSVCVNAAPFSLNKSRVDFALYSGPAGKWTYNGTDNAQSLELDNNLIDPSLYTVTEDPDYHYFTYRYTVPGSNCWAEDQTKFRVNK